jgi:hypothetical protein
MLLAVFFVASSLAFGYSLSLLFNFFDDLHKRTAFAALVGPLTATWLVLALSWFAGGLSAEGVAFVSLALLATGAVILKKTRAAKTKAKVKKTTALAADRAGLAFVLILTLLFAAINFRVILEPDGKGNWVSVINVWGDGPLHYAIINSFALRGNFPPNYPVLVNAPMAYPFLMDFASAILVKGGFLLREAFILPQVIAAFALFSFAYFFVSWATKSKAAAIIAMLLFFFNGNAGMLSALNDAWKNPGALLSPAADYSHIEPQNLWFMNFLYSTFTPQRSALLGFAAAVFVFALLYRNFLQSKKPDGKELLLAGVITGLLPLAHTHSFLVVLGVAACLFFYRPSRSWFYFALPLLLAVPQVLWIFQQASGNQGIQIGWIPGNENKNILELAAFWLANAWVPLALVFIGVFIVPKAMRVFYAPFVLLFFIANVVRFQPWAWDNIKMFLPWFFVTCVIAGVVVAKLFESKHKSTGRRLAFAGLGTVLLAVSIFSGVLSVVWMVNGTNSRYESFPLRDQKVASWIQSNTPVNAVFLTGEEHGNLVPSLAGRQIVMGFRGWLWSHGLRYSQVESDWYRMWQQDCGALRKYNVSYVFIGPSERSEADLRVEDSFFEASQNFEKVYDQSFDGLNYKIFKVAC